MKGLLEICCGSFEDVKTAWENGADRVELKLPTTIQHELFKCRQFPCVCRVADLFT